MTARVVGVSSYGEMAASTRVRMCDWFNYLGVDVEQYFYVNKASNGAKQLFAEIATVKESERRLRALKDQLTAQTCFISRRARPFGKGKTEASLLRNAAHGVYDFDDAVFMPASFPKSLMVSPDKIWRASVASADVVIAGNDYLADHASRWSPHVHVVPSCVDPGLYARKLEYDIPSQPTAVWIGSPSTEQYLLTIKEALLRAHRDFDLRLLIVSGQQGKLDELMPMVERIVWDPQTFGSVIAKADFGIMPLPDNQWTKGKCAYKLLQYGAAALPLIGSPVGANERVLTGASGIGPNDEGQWYESFKTLIEESAAQRQIRGETAYSFIESNYSFAAWSDTWSELVFPN